MKAVVYRQYGPPEVLESTIAPEPQIQERQMLVKVYAAGVNPVDWKLRAGHPKIPGFKGRIPGSDLSGKVLQIGKAVTRFKVGDEVFGLLSPFAGGACAEDAAVPEKNAALKPQNLSFEEAAALPIAGLTALQSLRDLGKIKPGDRVLINGASGGVGHFAVQIAKEYGAEVTGVTSGKNFDFVKALGADRLIDYTRENFTDSARRYDIIFDTVAARTFKECKPVLRAGGCYITTLPSVETVLQMMLQPFRRRGPKAKIYVVKIRFADLQILAEWCEKKKLRPILDKTFPISETREAHRYGEMGHARGKIVIDLSK